MSIRMAHLRTQGIDFAVFAADAPSRTPAARQHLLDELVYRARAQGLNIDKAALCYSRGGGTEFFGSADLVRYLARAGIPRWTHVVRA